MKLDPLIFMILKTSFTRQQRAVCPDFVPWSFVKPHEKQALINHSQDLLRLNERGGLSPWELYLTVNGITWGAKTSDTCPIKTEDQAIEWLNKELEKLANG